MKRGFTLIEVLLSITILSLLTLAIIQSTNLFETSLHQTKTLYNHAQKIERLRKLLYYDLFCADSITIKNNANSDYDHIFLHTNNSLYGIAQPFVLWYVAKHNRTLVRIESPKPIELDKEYPFIDIFATQTETFKLYRSKTKFFLFIATQEKEFFFELEK